MKRTALADAVHCVLEWSAEQEEEQTGAAEEEALFPTDFTDDTDSVGDYFITMPS